MNIYIYILIAIVQIKVLKLDQQINQFVKIKK